MFVFLGIFNCSFPRAMESIQSFRAALRCTQIGFGGQEAPNQIEN